MKTLAVVALVVAVASMAGCSSSVHPNRATNAVPIDARPPKVEVRGWLRMTGGPAGAPHPGVPGTVVFMDRTTGERTSAVAAASGSFGVVLPPGRYDVTGTSPRYLAGRGNCRTGGPAVVPASGLSGLVVTCSRRSSTAALG